MSQTVIGIFDNATQAQNAVQQLLNNGFSHDYIDVSSRGTTDTGTVSDSTYSGSSQHSDSDFGDKVSRFFSNLFDADDDRNNYAEVGRRGSVVTVHAQTAQEAERAADLLDQYGAVDVNERAQQYRSGTYSDTSAAYTNDVNTARTTTDIDETRNSLNVIEEDLQVGKRVVNTGGVRLRSRIVERPVEETLRLREERVHIERNPVNRPATAADLNNFQEGTIEVTERAEVPVVNKEARVVEEVRLEKDVTEREEVIRDTVRRTDVDVEDLRTDEERTRLSRDQDDLNRPGTL